MTKKRIAIVFIPSLLLIGVLAALILGQFSNRLPAEGQYLLDSYLEASPGEVMLTAVTFAHDHEQFMPDMGRAIIHHPIEEYRTSPVLYDGDIILDPGENEAQFPFPVQELWCVTLARNFQPDDYLLLARHEHLYGSNWVLYQSRIGIQTTEVVGCDPL